MGKLPLLVSALHWPDLLQQHSVATRWPHLYPHLIQCEPPVSMSKWQIVIIPRTCKGGWERWILFFQPLQFRESWGRRRDRCRASHPAVSVIGSVPTGQPSAAAEKPCSEGANDRVLLLALALCMLLVYCSYLLHGAHHVNPLLLTYPLCQWWKSKLPFGPRW